MVLLSTTTKHYDVVKEVIVMDDHLFYSSRENGADTEHFTTFTTSIVIQRRQHTNQHENRMISPTLALTPMLWHNTTKLPWLTNKDTVSRDLST